ncbi:hypothetical protein FOMPIDRAFT_91090, partial [Fomitopsis schrenkii]
MTSSQEPMALDSPTAETSQALKRPRSVTPPAIAQDASEPSAVLSSRKRLKLHHSPPPPPPGRRREPYRTQIRRWLERVSSRDTTGHAQEAGSAVNLLDQAAIPRPFGGNDSRALFTFTFPYGHSHQHDVGALADGSSLQETVASQARNPSIEELDAVMIDDDGRVDENGISGYGHFEELRMAGAVPSLVTLQSPIDMHSSALGRMVHSGALAGNADDGSLSIDDVHANLMSLSLAELPNATLLQLPMNNASAIPYNFFSVDLQRAGACPIDQRHPVNDVDPTTTVSPKDRTTYATSLLSQSASPPLPASNPTAGVVPGPSRNSLNAVLEYEQPQITSVRDGPSPDVGSPLPPMLDTSVAEATQGDVGNTSPPFPNWEQLAEREPSPSIEALLAPMLDTTMAETVRGDVINASPNWEHEPPVEPVRGEPSPSVEPPLLPAFDTAMAEAARGDVMNVNPPSPNWEHEPVRDEPSPSVELPLPPVFDTAVGETARSDVMNENPP